MENVAATDDGECFSGQVIEVCQLQAFVEYQARLAGVPLCLVDPKHTSREGLASRCVTGLDLALGPVPLMPRATHLIAGGPRLSRGIDRPRFPQGPYGLGKVAIGLVVVDLVVIVIDPTPDQPLGYHLLHTLIKLLRALLVVV